MFLHSRHYVIGIIIFLLSWNLFTLTTVFDIPKTVKYLDVGTI